MTIKLYDNDSYLTEFEGTVLSCDKCEEGYKTVLDQTAFFPEGGGQDADTGVLGERKVLHVRETEGMIYHVADGPLAVGETVEGTLDWNLRFPRMQNHAAEHILSGLAHTGYGCNNVGFHLNDEGFTVDFDKALTSAETSLLEREANEVIWKNEPIRAWYPTPEELILLDYRAKLDLTEGVRLVKMGEADLCACCGIHTAFTGEVGLVKLTSCVKLRGGVRIVMRCGGRALQDREYRRYPRSPQAW